VANGPSNLRGSQLTQISDDLLERARGCEDDAKRLAEGCLKVIQQPWFSESTPRAIDGQLYVVKLIKTYSEWWPRIFKALHQPFLEATGMFEERFQLLMAMPWSIELDRQIRSALKAVRTIPREPLPGEEIYPRKNWLGQYLTYMEGAEAPLAYHWWCGCALLGAACRRNIYFNAWRYDLFPNYYLFIVGPSAFGKGNSIDATTPLLYEANQHWVDSMNLPPPYGVRGEDGKIADGPREDKAWPNRQIVILPNKASPQDIVKAMLPRSQDQNIGDLAKEAVIKLRGMDSVSWLANGEASSILQRRDNLADGCIKLWTDSYSCKEIGFGSGTIARGREQLEFECFNIVLGSTLEWINTSISADMMQAGFVRRCLFVYRDESSPSPNYDSKTPPPRDPLSATLLSMQLSYWMGLWNSKEVAPTESGFRAITELRKKWRKECTDPPVFNMQPYYLGKFNLVMKTAMVLAVNDYTNPNITPQQLESMLHLDLTSEHVQLAQFLLETEEAHMKECFARMGEHRTATEETKVFNTITAHNRRRGEPMILSELRSLCRDIPSLTKVCSRLVDLGMLDTALWKRGRGKGKAARCFWNPEVLDWQPSPLQES